MTGLYLIGLRPLTKQCVVRVASVRCLGNFVAPRAKQKSELIIDGIKYKVPDAVSMRTSVTGDLLDFNRKLLRSYEVYPLTFLLVLWVGVFCVIVYASLNKSEITLTRSEKKNPLDWRRMRDRYWKYHTILYDPENRTRRRLPIMEQLQDEMLEASDKRKALKEH